MAETTFSSRLLCPNTWLIQGEGCTSYLVVGDKEGVLIDTGFSTENIQAYAQKLTDKPVRAAANTHGHFDHTSGNGWFERTYMSAKALEIAKTPYPSKANLNYPLQYMVTIVGEGDRIDLGGRTLEVFEIPAHAPSSIAFLDGKEKILFAGDEVAPHVMLVWMQDEPQPTIEQHARNMKKLLEHRASFDHICWGHGDGFISADLVEILLENDQRILSGIEGSPLEMQADGPEDFHIPQIEFKRLSSYKGTTIGYDMRFVFDK